MLVVHLFSSFDCLYQVRPKMAAQEAEWQPRKSQLEKEKAKSGGVGGEGASVGDPQALVPSQQQPLLSPVRDDSKSPPSSPTEGTPGGQRYVHIHTSIERAGCS